MTRILIASGAELNSESHWRDNHPLAIAIDRGQTDMVRFLLINGADVSGHRKIVQEALSYAESQGYTSIVRAMAEYGINVFVAVEEKVASGELSCAGISHEQLTVHSLPLCGRYGRCHCFPG